MKAKRKLRFSTIFGNQNMMSMCAQLYCTYLRIRLAQYIYIYMYVRACVCVVYVYVYVYFYIHIYIYIYIYMRACVYVFGVCLFDNHNIIKTLCARALVLYEQKFN